MSGHDPRDLVVIALSGVQTYITESRTTADAANASDIMARLGTSAAEGLENNDGVELVIPTRADPSAASSRIVALVPPGSGAELAHRAAENVRALVRERLTELFASERDVPGFPEVLWTVVPAEAGDYAERWEISRSALEARKVLRAFDYPERRGTRPCAVSPRWPSERHPPARVPEHERGGELSAAVWLKRRWHRLPSVGGRGFPSTASIASTPFRARVLERWDSPGVRELVTGLEDAARAVMGRERSRFLEGAVPALNPTDTDEWDDPLKKWFVRGAGWWVTPETWNVDTLSREYGTEARPVDPDAVARGLDTTRALVDLVESEANPYYAVLTADLDGLGDHLSSPPVTAERHRAVSLRLEEVSEEHRRRIKEEHSGVTVYSGGDDLLAFLPAATALETARSCREAVAGDPTTLSCAVVFAHQGSPLHTVISRARELLAEAKNVPGKNAVAVGYITGSGARSHTVRPWSSASVGDALGALRTFEPRSGRPVPRTATDGALSPRLIGDLHGERTALAELARADEKTYEAEVTRLILRHGGTGEQARNLLAMGASEHAEGSPAPVPLAAARVAVFLRSRAW
ncbi:type III-B CRISPR-associated protein Cas10/Cmr2 [Nocardiopsis lambiniae]|uniref:Type III-B CRISPR-associated protein Cas10/Cmr2 n=1 Tax=Nocardiopsis lambiniae TaxID=3075539 RepID=A0ABU2M9R3_9ACTN|nr:type III-B CRISPR-associated protein Cas10/Cmr2 [Nocardiopsis sp. DSM 44743]MDT0329347.1 type III-B CRISPR-associated protein Cas10/Cmr2 [Nocardiopsis sp. DSM 44743]